MDTDTLKETIEISREQIEQLSGKRNWNTWKFRITIMLRRVKNAFEIIDGRLNMPDQPAVGAADEAINQFRLKKSLKDGAMKSFSAFIYNKCVERFWVLPNVRRSGKYFTPSRRRGSQNS